MKEKLEVAIGEVLKKLDISALAVSLTYPESLEHGDFSTNVALAAAKNAGIAPRALAEKIMAELNDESSAKAHALKPDFVESISIAGPGFINFKVKDQVFVDEVLAISKRFISEKQHFTQVKRDTNRQVMIEYTDPNIFKVFHIGHMMSNAIGESLSRLIEYSGAKIIRICYPSDIGLHIAKSLWALRKHIKELPSDTSSIQDKTTFLGKMYVEGTNAYEADPVAKIEIDALNKTLYDKSDNEINMLYEKGKAWSLEHFELLYKLLGTKFDEYIYESEMAPKGLELVKKHLDDIFETSDGAVVFKGEEFALHTRVFISSHGLPTYETKELGLNVTKFEKHPDADESIIVTASEQNDYFKVLKQVFLVIDKKNGPKTKHIGHGMMRFASGKMSSRTGNVVSAESLINDVKKLVMEKMADRKLGAAETDEIANAVAIAAIKYTVLRSSVGSDIIFDSVKSISFEGDSGPYLQYSAVRAQSVLKKAGDGKSAGEPMVKPKKVSLLEKLITRFDGVALRARTEYAPQLMATYLIELAGAFNSFYASNVIVDPNEPLSLYRIALTKVFLETMMQGLWLLGIKVPPKM